MITNQTANQLISKQAEEMCANMISKPRDFGDEESSQILMDDAPQNDSADGTSCP